MSQQVQESNFEEFLDALRSPKTLQSYRTGIRYILGDLAPDDFLTMAKNDPRAAEDHLIRRIKSKRGRASETVSNPVDAVKSFLIFYDVHTINWKKLAMVLPPVNKVADDRPPTREEIRQLLAAADLRMKLVILMLASSGARVGVFEYPLPDRTFGYLRLKHVRMFDFEAWKEVDLLLWLNTYDKKKDEHVIGIVNFYAKDPASYDGHFSVEATAALRAYLEARTKLGEKLSPQSPVIRNDWGWDFMYRRLGTIVHQQKYDPNEVAPTKEKNLQNQIGELWIKSGVRKPLQEDETRQEFQAVHGFRKFFETVGKAMAGTPVEKDDGSGRPVRRVTEEAVGILKGGKRNYNKPELEDYKLRCYLTIMPRLLVGEEWQLKTVVATIEEKHESAWRDNRLETLELKEQLRQQGDTIRQLSNIMSQIKAERLKELGVGVDQSG